MNKNIIFILIVIFFVLLIIYARIFNWYSEKDIFSAKEIIEENYKEVENIVYFGYLNKEQTIKKYVTIHSDDSIWVYSIHKDTSHVKEDDKYIINTKYTITRTQVNIHAWLIKESINATNTRN